MCPYFTLIIAPKYKSSEAGNLDMPKRSNTVLPLNEKVKVLDLIRNNNKNHMLRLLGTNLLFVKLWGRKKKFILDCGSNSNSKVTATVSEST